MSLQAGVSSLTTSRRQQGMSHGPGVDRSSRLSHCEALELELGPGIVHCQREELMMSGQLAGGAESSSA